jgi:hypothetical protein
MLYEHVKKRDFTPSRGHVAERLFTPRQSPRCGRSGQAAIEFAVGLLLMLIVVTGIIHVSRMARTSLFLHSVLRGEAGKDAMTSLASSTPDYISDWKEGPDGIRYTADDQPVRNSAMLPATLDLLTQNSVANPTDWDYVASGTRLPVSMCSLQASPIMATTIGFVHAEETLHVPVDSVIRQLIYDKDEVSIKEEVWVPLMGGLY